MGPGRHRRLGRRSHYRKCARKALLRYYGGYGYYGGYAPTYSYGGYAPAYYYGGGYAPAYYYGGYRPAYYGYYGRPYHRWRRW